MIFGDDALERVKAAAVVILLIASAYSLSFLIGCETVQQRVSAQTTAAETQTDALLHSGVIVSGHVLTAPESAGIISTLADDSQALHAQQKLINKDEGELTFFRKWGFRVGLVVVAGLIFVVFKILKFFRVIP